MTPVKSAVPGGLLTPRIVITQVFPDEFHLNTLDQFLSATARLNPHVNVKAIVIGMMDKLSTYASRDSESETPEQRLKKEEEATAKLLERLKLTEKEKEASAKTQSRADDDSAPAQPNGTPATEDAAPEGNTDKPEESSEAADTNGVSATDGEAGKQEDESKTNTEDTAEDIKLYEIFYQQVLHLVHVKQMPFQDIMALSVSLLNLALYVGTPHQWRPLHCRNRLTDPHRRLYPDRLDYVDQVLTYAAEKVEQHANTADLYSPPAQTNILNLLLAPIKSYASLFTALALPSFLPLLRAQTYPTRRAVAREVARNILKNRTKIETPEHVEGVLEILKVLVKEGMQQPTGYPGVQTQRRGMETDETIEEQGWLARIVHLIQSPNNDSQFKVRPRRDHLPPLTSLRGPSGGHCVELDMPATLTCSLSSSSKSPAKSSPKAATASNTPPQPSSPPPSLSPDGTKPANTTTTTGQHSPPPSTNSCTTLSPACTPASTAQQSSVSVSSSPAVRSQTRPASKKSRMNSSRKLSPSMKKPSAIPARSSKPCASLPAHSTARAPSAKRITTRSSLSARFMAVSC